MDPIADMLTAIRNAQAARLPVAIVPMAKQKMAILELLSQEGYIESFKVSEEPKAVISINLKYQNRQPVINHLKRISKPGLRVYRQRQSLPRPLRGMGMAIISTPAGMLTDKEARKQGLGGEIICEVW